MNDKKIVVETKLSMTDYISLVNAIALEYFDEDGSYHPYIGELNAMRLFWNLCVKESHLDSEELGHDLHTILDIEDVVADDEFIEAYNAAICDCTRVEMTFGCAYNVAKDMVNHRKSSLTSVVDMIKGTFENLINSLGSVATPENIQTLTKIVKEVSNGTDLNKVIAEYGKGLIIKNK